MPELAASASSALLAGWSLPEGSTFAKGDVLAVVETEKAQVEVTGEQDGVLVKTLVGEGTEVPTGQAIAVLGDPHEDLSDVGSVLASLGMQLGAAQLPEAEHGQPAALHDGEARNGKHGAAPPGEERVFTSPLARRLARDAGISLPDIVGTGPGGRIVRRDIESAIRRRAANGRPDQAAKKAIESPRPGAAAAEPAATPGAGPPAWIETPHTRFRRSIAERLTASVTTAPHFSIRVDCLAGGLVQLREDINGVVAAHRVSLTDLLVKAVAGAHLRVPEMNVTWHPDVTRRYDAVDIGIAIATDAGVVAPVIRDVGAKAVSAIAAETRRLRDLANAGELASQDLSGGVITVSNLGMYDTDGFSAIINPPQSAIVAVGAVRDRPVVIDGVVCVAPAVTLVASVDHRPIDGALAARWLQELKRLIENPIQILT